MYSFIIPAYNAEKDLDRAVNSILSYNENDIEVIIIENGSTDRTSDIAYNLRESNDCVKVFHAEKGVSNARNLGITEAKGEWICFVDSDDTVRENILKVFRNATQKVTADLYVFGYLKGNKAIYPKLRNGDTCIIKQCKMIKNPTRYMTVWGKLFKREIIIDNLIDFNRDLKLSEDSDFLIRYMSYCKDILFSKECIYNYELRGSSATRGYTGTMKEDYLKALRKTDSRIAIDNYTIREAFNIYIAVQLNLIMVKEVFSIDNNKQFKNKIQDLKQITQDCIFRKAISEINLLECLSVRLLPIGLIKLHLYRLCGLVYQLRSIHNNSKAKDEK